jgi:type III secretion protein R
MGGLENAALLALVAIVPLVALTLTSFVKLSVVLSLLRNALGATDAPSGLVIMGLSLVLTFFVMAPVGIDMVRAAATSTSPAPAPGTVPAPAPGTAPAPATQAPASSAALDPDRTVEAALRAVVPELREAFVIAILIFIPFLVIDLVVGLSLASLGLQSTSPQSIALPLKLVLFVAVDGWRLLLDALLRGYA